MKINENTVLIGKTVVLTPYKAIHVAKYHEWMTSPFLQEMTASEPLSIEEEYDMQTSWHVDADKCTFIVHDAAKVDRLDETAAMVGDVNLFLNDVDDRTAAEIEVMIAEETARGKGMGREALLQLMRYGLENLHLTKYVAKIAYANAPSLKLFDSLGFKEVSRADVFQEVTLELHPIAEALWEGLPGRESTAYDGYFSSF